MSWAAVEIYVGQIAWPITVLGPGRRVGLWLTGCTLNCPGCMSPHFFMRQPTQRMTVAAVMKKLQPGLRCCDGLTVSGGEPFQQPWALHSLLQAFHHEFPGKDVLVYSGYTIEEIWRDAEKRLALRGIDLLIDGRFEVKNTQEKIWRGSDNQRLLLLSERAQQYAHWREAKSRERVLQVAVTAEGELRILGIPARGTMNQLRVRLQAASLAGMAERQQV